MPTFFVSSAPPQRPLRYAWAYIVPLALCRLPTAVALSLPLTSPDIAQVLRLSLQAEVKAGESKARRSKTTGSLVVTMPKVDPDQVMVMAA